jgi:protein TonB
MNVRGAVMFEESLLESSNLLRTRNRWPAVAALALQATVAAAVIIVPLMRPDVLPLRLPAFAPLPPVPITRTPPPQRVHVQASTSSTAPTAPAPQTIAQGPQLTPTLNPNRFGDEPPAIGNITGMSGNGTSLDPSIISSGTSSPNIVVAAPAKPARVNISQGVSAGMLLAPIRPVYPPIAVAARREGIVVIHAIISKTGTIESANVVSGPAMLQGAALDAIRSARYRPYRLNGDPTEVDTTFSVIFRLNS